MEKTMKLEQAVELLNEFAQYEGCELGDYWNAIVNAYELCYNSCYISDDFSKALKKEIIKQAKQAEQDFKLVEKTQTITHKTKELVEVEHNKC